MKKKTNLLTFTQASISWMAMGCLLVVGTVVSCTSAAQTAVYPSAGISGNNNPSSSLAFEKYTGYYQLPDKVSFLHVEEASGGLIATKLWDGRQTFELKQLDATHFESKAEGYKLEFMQENSSKFNEVKILGKVTSVRVDYDPTAAIQLTAAKLKRLEGTYELSKDQKFELVIKASQDGLTLKQSWDGKEISFTPRSEEFFLSDDKTFPLTFQIEQGNVKQLTCFKDDTWNKSK